MCLHLGDSNKLQLRFLDKICNMIIPQTFSSMGYIPVSTLADITANDDKGENISTISKATNSGAKLLLDMDIVLSGSPAQITNDFYLVAEPNMRHSITVNTAEEVFSLTSDVKKIHLYNIDVIGSAASNRLFFNDYVADGEPMLDELLVENCKFKGISLYRQEEDRLYVGLKLAYIKKFQFINNIIEDVITPFCEMTDIMFDLIAIKNNNVRNFYYTIFNFGTTNVEDDFTDDQIEIYEVLTAGKKALIVDRNVVKNDFDCIQETDSKTYYTFVLAECDTCSYTNNHVEGLKASGSIPLYDSYLSCNSVVYEGNLWKNNLCFSPTHVNCTLMKAKGGSGSKIFRNNTYIIEEEYVKRLKDEYSDIGDTGFWVDLLSCIDESAWEVYDNVINLAVSLRLFSSSIPAVKVDILNNNIKATNFTGSITARALNYPSYWRFEDNVLEATSTEYDKDTWLSLFAKASVVGGLTRMLNNVFNVPYARLTATAGDVTPDSGYIVDGNRFVVAEMKYMTMSNFTHNEFVCKNNNLEPTETDATQIITFADTEILPYRKMQLRIDTSECRYDPIPIYLEIPEDRIIQCTLKLRHETNDVVTDGHITINTTADGHLKIYDVKNSRTHYGDDPEECTIHPSADVIDNIYTNLLRQIIYADVNKKSRIQGGGKPGVLDIDFEVYQTPIKSS